MGTMKFRIEPELQYCPQCQDEYRADMVTCVSCEVALISGSQMLEIHEQKNNHLAGRAVEITPDDDLTDILKGQVLDMKNVQALLKGEGFSSIIAGDSNTCGQGCCGAGEVRLQVRTADLPEISQVLAKEHAVSTALIDHDVSSINAVYDTGSWEATCPACGCSFSTQSNTCPDCGLCF